MNLDLRLPLGALFAVLGAVMFVYGLHSDPAIYRRSLGINVNEWWGLAQLLFGIATGAAGLVAGRSRRARRERERSDV